MDTPADCARASMRCASSGMPRKADGLRDVRGLPAEPISAPVFGQVQLAVEQGMAERGRVGEKDAHLAVGDLTGRPTILPPDPGGVLAAFGETAFIDDQHREG